MPNAESSPLWSLTDTSPAPQPLPEPEVAREALDVEIISPVISPVPEARPVPVSLESAPEDAASASANEPPRESRKGWWQRRFKA